MRPLALVVAVGEGGVIGEAGALPWRLPEDLAHFKAVTLGHVLVMGRKTWDSIGRPLPGRTSFVLSRRVAPRAGAETFASLEDALDAAWRRDPEPRVIGGAAVYREALPLATKIYLTEVHAPARGDTLFPPFDRAAFVEVERRAGASDPVTFLTLERRA